MKMSCLTFLFLSDWILEVIFIFMQYYYEPETGVKFRSLIAVERYLVELDEDAPLSKTFGEILEKKPPSQAFKVENFKVSSIVLFFR